MQYGSLVKQSRKNGPEVWCFRWRECGATGKLVRRSITIGTANDFNDPASARDAVIALVREANSRDLRIRTTGMTLSQLTDHYRQRELIADNIWKSYSTRYAYQIYLRKWILPRWGDYALDDIKPAEVESWLRQLALARSSCAKIRNLMSVLFNHARRHELFDRNPIRFVRQGAKRRRTPDVLTVAELQQLLAALPWRERMLVLLAAGTGLRRSELFALKWKDVDFAAGQLSVTRSIVYQVVGICKTEASQKPVPLHFCLIEALAEWRQRSEYRAPEDWVFASPQTGGKRPYWPEQIMNRHIRPVVRALAIDKRVGWHTFRHTYSTLLKSVGADLKVMQELLRHASIRVTLDHYTQAITPAKRAAQSAVVTLLFPAQDAAEKSA